jgi:hypothetical protein
MGHNSLQTPQNGLISSQMHPPAPQEPPRALRMPGKGRNRKMGRPKTRAFRGTWNQPIWSTYDKVMAMGTHGGLGDLGSLGTQGVNTTPPTRGVHKHVRDGKRTSKHVPGGEVGLGFCKHGRIKRSPCVGSVMSGHQEQPITFLHDLRISSFQSVQSINQVTLNVPGGLVNGQTLTGQVDLDRSTQSNFDPAILTSSTRAFQITAQISNPRSG